MVLFGLYIGNTSANIALYKKGKVEVISNDIGERLTPSIVAYTSSDLVVGTEAKQCIGKNECSVIHSMKMAIANNGLADDNNSIKMVTKNDTLCFEILRKDKPTLIPLPDVLVAIFKKLMECAKSQITELDSCEAVISTSYEFDAKQRKIVSDAATKAGFEILRVISEPSSALLAYDIGQQSPHNFCNIVILRIGGNTMDVTLANHANGMFRIIDSFHDDKSGGFLLDNLVADFFISEFQRQTRLDCRENKRANLKLFNSAETCKRILSNLSTTNCSLESLHQDRDFNCGLSRSRLEALAAPLLQGWLQKVEEVLVRNRMPVEKVHKVVLCGGMCRMPLLQQTIKDKFSHVEILSSIPPDEVFSMGAAIQASILSGKDMDILKRNEDSIKFLCLSYDLIIEQEGMEAGEVNVVFPVGSPIPSKRHFDFGVDENKQNCIFWLKMALVTISPITLAKIVITDITNKNVSINFHLKQDGSLHLHWKSGKDCKSNSLIVPVNS